MNCDLYNSVNFLKLGIFIFSFVLMRIFFNLNDHRNRILALIRLFSLLISFSFSLAAPTFLSLWYENPILERPRAPGSFLCLFLEFSSIFRSWIMNLVDSYDSIAIFLLIIVLIHKLIVLERKDYESVCLFFNFFYVLWILDLKAKIQMCCL